ncbi:hypothetical protein [Phenylobacterium aquaticum]|uniref:hypothetical protein n=1 Tax=Phenylobacterium aquaticum TaxID=1763816 RepID=UPI001F5DC6D8|nr:hypothetical protein [Phenylobacterium aquaticum]MCI3133033.1 hypothetical protein [Phenylobacterium aquaticum]
MAKQAAATTGPTTGQLPERIIYNCGTMIGACATLIGLVKIVETHKGPSHVDEYAGGAAVAFVLSALFAYLSLRSDQRTTLHHRLELVADTLFILGLVGLGIIGAMFAFEVI